MKNQLKTIGLMLVALFAQAASIIATAQNRVRSVFFSLFPDSEKFFSDMRPPRNRAERRAMERNLEKAWGDPRYGSEAFNGDPYMGDINFSQFVRQAIGDPGEEGDGEDGDAEEGDINTAGEYGDGNEMGSPARKAKRQAKKVKRIKKAISKKSGKLSKLTGASQAVAVARAAEGKFNPTDSITFASVSGLILQSITQYPNNAAFEAKVLKNTLDTSKLETPGVVTTIQSTTPSIQFGTAYGASVYFRYPLIVIKLGVSMLNGIANQTITVNVVMPLYNGANVQVDLVCQLQEGFDGTITLYPYQLVQSKPVLVYGKAGGAALGKEILVTITGLPSSSVASLIVPYSEHQLFKALEIATS